jgi:single-stranded-DNA-specific exonuclease
MSFRWVYAKPEKEESVSELEDQLGIPPVIARLLSLRDVTSFSDAKSFFRPDIGHLHNPFLMKDMEKASRRLASAVCNREKVLVYGDYDVDGTTATASLLLFLKNFGIDATYYIPHRFKEGYGINPDGVRYASEIGASLIVSVDCGITAVDEARQAKELGIDLIICDHHTVGNEIPECVAVLDPKRPDCTYPFEGLSGAGVGFKLIQATIEKLGLSVEKSYEYLDLIAISIASDIVPIIDENRVLMRKGLKLINDNARPGIKALINLVFNDNRTEKVTTSTIVFSIGPRINAAGRMGDAAVAVELMISETDENAIRIARNLEQINDKRRETDRRTMDEAMAMLDSKFDLEELSSMVLHHPDWNLGVIGIVASRLVDTYYRPAIMLSTVEGKIKGSARSVKGFNIYDALKECEDLLEQFGGHEFAAGLTMDKQNLAEFRNRIDQIAFHKLQENDFKPELMIDSKMDLSHVNLKFWKLLSQFEPFGPGNLRPVFVSEDVDIHGDPTIVGKGHLKMKIRQNGSAIFDTIGFNMHEFMPAVRESKDRRVDVAYVIEENFWNNKRTLQLRLKDIHVQN